MLNISGDYLFRNNLKGSLQYSHTWLKEKTKLGWESKSTDDLYATLSAIKRVFNLADVYLFGGSGFVVNPEKETKVGVCCGLGVRKKISSSVSFEFNFRIQRTLDEVRPMRDWKSFYIGLNFRVPERTVESSITREDEAEIIIRYLAAGLKKISTFQL